MGHILELIAQVHHCHSAFSPSSLLLPISLPLFLSLSLCLSHAVPLLPSRCSPPFFHTLSLSLSLSLPLSLSLCGPLHRDLALPHCPFIPLSVEPHGRVSAGFSWESQG